jgi:hypothetical protein
MVNTLLDKLQPLLTLQQIMCCNPSVYELNSFLDKCKTKILARKINFLLTSEAIQFNLFQKSKFLRCKEFILFRLFFKFEELTLRTSCSL